jgi:glycosyltransferase involved in cell wall biosynthesis
LIFHGYLLRGTGSNIYNASVAAALAKLGHEVHLLCQDREAGELPWVDAVGELGAGPGTVTAHIPDIGGLLPVYVADRYEGFEAKTFADLSEAELDRYLEANVAAVQSVVEAAGGVDAALANHLVMGPVILARAGLGADDGGPGYAVKIHGSALEFTVRPNPDRFLPYAREGTGAAAGILVGSRHTAESLWATVADPELPPKTRLGPPGVDTRLFAPAESPADAVAEVRALANEISSRSGAGGGEWGEDATVAVPALEDWAAADGPRVVFVGKLIGTKGLDLLLAAWPLVVRANPGARLLVIAFGEGRDVIVDLLAALDAGDIEAARRIAAKGMVTTETEPIPLRFLDFFLAAAPDGYADWARGAAGTVSLAGRLEHDDVARVMPAAEALVFPSTFPEAFGMVAAEAAACGVLPIGADHSGIREVALQLATVLAPDQRGLLSFPLGEGSVEAIAERLNGWLALDEAARVPTRRALSERVHELWSWESVAEGVVAASAGRVDELPSVPGRE